MADTTVNTMQDIVRSLIDEAGAAPAPTAAAGDTAAPGAKTDVVPEEKVATYLSKAADLVARLEGGTPPAAKPADEPDTKEKLAALFPKEGGSATADDPALSKLFDKIRALGAGASKGAVTAEPKVAEAKPDPASAVPTDGAKKPESGGETDPLRAELLNISAKQAGGAA